MLKHNPVFLLIAIQCIQSTCLAGQSTPYLSARLHISIKQIKCLANFRMFYKVLITYGSVYYWKMKGLKLRGVALFPMDTTKANTNQVGPGSIEEE